METREAVSGSVAPPSHGALRGHGRRRTLVHLLTQGSSGMGRAVRLNAEVVGKGGNIFDLSANHLLECVGIYCRLSHLILINTLKNKFHK